MQAAKPTSRVVNLLPLIEVIRDRVAGAWNMAKDVLSCDAGSEHRLEILYQPPDEYDFCVVFERTSGRGDVHQHLSKAGHAFSYVMDWHGDGSFHLDTVNQNRTDQRFKSLVNGTKHTAIVQVRNDSVRTLLDGVQVIEAKTDFQKAQCWSGRKLRNENVLGVGANQGAVTFYKLELVEITGVGKPLR